MTWSFLSLVLTLYLICLVTSALKLNDSHVISLRGHYPYKLCQITNVAFVAKEGTFYVQADDDVLNTECDAAIRIWQIKADNEVTLHQQACDEYYDVGHTFLVFYWARNSNYYHIHYDTLIPLYKHIYHDATLANQKLSRLLMPAVELTRLNKIDWTTNAFESEVKYWYNSILILADKYTVKPLTDTIRSGGKNICFGKVYFGTKSVDFTDKSLIKSFVQFVTSHLNVDTQAWKKFDKPKVGIISRKNRRLILNEDQLVKSLEDIALVELLQLENHSYRKQVQMMQDYTVLVGMNGAGLMNGLFLPPQGVVIQLVPYKAQLNHKQFGDILNARGPYMVWHNTHENLTRTITGDKYTNKPNTIVHVQEFRRLVTDAIAHAHQEYLNFHKSEL